MINLNLAIENPWSDRWDILWSKNGPISKYKAWEFNGYHTNYIVVVDCKLNFRSDHAGGKVMLGLLGYTIEFNVYDIRHWNHDLGDWEKSTQNT